MTENMIFNKKEITMVNILHKFFFSSIHIFIQKVIHILMYKYVDIPTADRFIKTQRENHDKTK